MSRSSSQVSQNVDNFLSEKSSTRLHQPPGGGSSVGSLIFGGGGCDESPFAGHQRRASISRPKEEAPEQVNPYSKDYRRSGVGNAGGYHQQHQSSSGPYPGYHQQQQPPPQQQQQSSGPYPGYQQHQHQQQQHPAQAQQYGGAPSRLSSNSYASGSNQNAGNVLTERRITRIHAPPGGKSSITFG